MVEMRIGESFVSYATQDSVLASVGGRLDDTSESARPVAIGSVNLDHLHHFAADTGNVLTGDAVDWVMLADGAPIAVRGRLLSGEPWPRLTGADLLPAILEVAAQRSSSVGFLGGTQEMHRSLEGVVTARWPALRAVHMWAPPRADLTDPARAAALAEDVGRFDVDLLVVGLGKPRQEMWIDTYGALTKSKVLLAFGASADFLAGRIDRAPELMQRVGAEWFYRLMLEPRRLAHRYLVEAPQQLKALRAAQLVGDAGPRH